MSGAVADNPREIVESRLRAFWRAALLRAGDGTSLAEGARRLSTRLADLGYEGRKGKGEVYNPDSIAHWPAGRTFPDMTVTIAVALDLGISLDRYIHGDAMEEDQSPSDETIASLAGRVEQIEEIQDFMQAWLMRDAEFGAELRRRRELRRRTGTAG